MYSFLVGKYLKADYITGCYLSALQYDSKLFQHRYDHHDTEAQRLRVPPAEPRESGAAPETYLLFSGMMMSGTGPDGSSEKARDLSLMRILSTWSWSICGSERLG